VSRRARLALLLAGVAIALLVEPTTALAAGNDVGRNIGSLLRHYAGQIYGGVIAIVGAVFFVAAILVGWLVFSPDQVADAARAIGQRVLP
jgi:hypothetical protein